MGDFRCYLSACRFAEFDNSIICHVLVYCFGSFLLQDVQVFACKCVANLHSKL